MAVDPVSSAGASAVVNAAATYVRQTTSSTSGTSSSLQEATETPAVTAKEAAKGDPVAKRLLAKQQQEKEQSHPTPAQEPGKGEQVDQKA